MFKQASKTALSLILMVALVSPGYALASDLKSSNTSENELKTAVMLDNDLTVHIFDDGRVEGINLSEKVLTSSEIEQVLKLMNHTESEINEMPDA